MVVDDQRLVRSGFAMMLSVEDDIEIVGEAADGAESVEMARKLRPDLVLMDVQMPVLDGIAATEQIVAEGLGQVVLLTTFDRDDYLFDGLQAGASGFLLKNTDPDDLVEAIRSVGLGHALLAPEVTRRVIERMTAAGSSADSGRAQAGALDRLTPREREVLELVGRGLSNGEIAGKLFLGEATVKTHVSSCLSKLHLRDRVQAVVFAYEAGLLRPGD
ncbi:response regulator [Flexivirga meconopsidis]|uniref:response regulator n=1 Tax=Flexivirga meconopsidis TaxID=2977121 RepID=UPI00223F62C9|nr:response regulator transcription factor [Flexivirga meconopsidis]